MTPLDTACPICKAQPGEHCLPGAPGFHHAPRAACKWFLQCARLATTTVPHPILGDVPCCARCAALATA